MNPAFVDWLRSNVPIIAAGLAVAAASFAAFNAYLNWRDRRLQVQVKLHVGPAIFRAGDASAGRDMLVVGLWNAGVPTTIVGCQFQAMGRDKKYRSSDERLEPRRLDRDGRESLMYTPAFLARALKQDGYRDVVSVRALVADHTGASFASHPVGLDIDWAIKEDAEFHKAMAKLARARIDAPPQEVRGDR